MSNLFQGATVISSYSNEQAIEDGFKRIVLSERDGTAVDVRKVAREAGFTVPVTLTLSLANLLEEARGVQSAEGRLWDVLWMGKLAIKRAPRDETFVSYVLRIGRRNRTVYAVLDAEGLTFMLPEDY